MSDEKKNDYKDTVFLPKTEFPMRGSLPQQEPKLLERWKAMDLYGRLRAQASGRKPFILHDGPPYANGNIHIGTALNKILKDVVVRSHQMLGFDAPYVPGWDCHGLPIEWKIEEQYREKGKDKDTVPVLQFRAECRAFAEHWKGVQSQEFQRLGVTGDWAHPYTTMTKKAEAQIVREIHKFLMNGLLYKGVKPVMWSVVEKTALAEAEVEYQDHTSTTLWIRFHTKGVSFPKGKELDFAAQEIVSQLEQASIVIWTTTPWTIPANRAIAYGDLEYIIIEVNEIAEGSLAKIGEKLVIADALFDKFCQDVKITRATKLLTVPHEFFEGVVYEHPFEQKYGLYYALTAGVLYGDFVTAEAGTGFVHIAPGHGEDDFKLGQKHKINIEETVGDDGRYAPSVKGFAGLYVYKPDGKTGEANGAVIKALLEANALLAKLNIKHSYPHSWRSKAPLIFRTTPQWFIAMDHGFAPANAEAMPGEQPTLRQLAEKAIGETTWVPKVGENRIRGMIETRPDWCISRQRAWGVPIALFVDKKTNVPLRDKAVLDCIAKAFETEGADAWYSHKPQDFLGDKHKAEDYTQVFDIVDVWFESGSTHAFVLEQNVAHSSAEASGVGASEWPNLKWPASLYLEGSDQHRGWFHSSLLESCGTKGRAPFDAVLTHGFIVDEQGRKMSKSLGNVTAPQEVIEKMGADILRLWVIASDYTDDLRIGPEILKQIGDTYRRFRNTLRYLLGALDGMTSSERLPVAEMPELEQWVLHRLHEMDALIRKDIAAFDYNHMLTALHDFCNTDLSAFYFDVRKDSLYCDRPDSKRRRAARTVLELLFNHLVLWLAPVIAFTAEEAFTMRHGAGDDSVHLHTFPAVPKEWQNDTLATKWDEIRKVRRVATGAMELARNDKKIGSSLQAQLHMYVKPEQKSLLESIDFMEVSISSGVTISAGASPAGAYTISDISDVGTTTDLAKGTKCERCWQVLEEVGKHKDHPDLCNRCHDAVTHLRKAAA